MRVKKHKEGIRYKALETVDKSGAFGGNMSVSLYRGGQINCTLGQKLEKREEYDRILLTVFKQNK